MISRPDRNQHLDAYRMENEEDLRRHQISLKLELKKDAPNINVILRQRLAIMKHEIGEPPLYTIKQIEKEIGLMVLHRVIELSEGRYGRSGHRSGVRIIFEHQELWGIEDGETLRQAITRLLLPSAEPPAPGSAPLPSLSR